MEEKQLRRIIETSYLNQENTWRYRPIINFCYTRHKHMQTNVYPSDIMNELKKHDYFAEYTMEQLEQDLKQLVDWNNLESYQETSRAATIDEFKKKQFRYKCTRYTIEIERMLEKLNSLGEEFSGSLETTRFSRILTELEELLFKYKDVEVKDLNQTWSDLLHNFDSLTKNAADYLDHLNSIRLENKIQLSAFIIYKDKFIKYLQEFILELQQTSDKIKRLLENADNKSVESFLDRLADYQMSLPHVAAMQKKKEDVVNELQDIFTVIKEWFIGNEYHESELNILYEATVESIRRIIRFAQQFSERRNNLRSRRNDYLTLAKWFTEIDDIDDAHKLAGAVFGMNDLYHYAVGEVRYASLSDKMQEIEPTELEVKIAKRGGREKTNQSIMHNRYEMQTEVLKAYLAKEQQNEDMLDSLTVNGVIDMGNLPVISEDIRRNLLTWIARCIQSSTFTTQMKNGNRIRLQWNKKSNPKVKVKCHDGEFTMPQMKLCILKKK